MPFKVTTWNVENFSSTAGAFAAKVDHLAGVLTTLAPDVVALQEVLDAEAVAALAARLNMRVTIGTPDSRGNRVAFLSRAEPAEVVQISAWSIPADLLPSELAAAGSTPELAQMPRPSLQITVEQASGPVTLINTHLKSKLLSYPGKNRFNPHNETERALVGYLALMRRAAESKTLRERATELLAQARRVVLLGDLNDGTDAATTALLYGPEGSQPRPPDVGQAPDDVNRANGAFQRGDGGDAQRLFNVTNFATAASRWTRKHEGRPELIDHILAGAALMPREGELRRIPQVEITRAEDLPSMGSQPRDNSLTPDHAPVTATFAI